MNTEFNNPFEWFFVDLSTQLGVEGTCDINYNNLYFLVTTEPNQTGFN